MERLINLKTYVDRNGKLEESTVQKDSSELSLVNKTSNGDYIIADREGKTYLMPLYNGSTPNSDVAVFDPDAYRKALAAGPTIEKGRLTRFMDSIRRSKVVPTALLLGVVSTFSGCEVPENETSAVVESTLEEGTLTGDALSTANAESVIAEKELVVTDEMIDEYTGFLKIATEPCRVFDGVDSEGNVQYRPLSDVELKDFTTYINSHITAKTNNELYLNIFASDEDNTRIENNARVVADAITNAEITDANTSIPWEVCIINPEAQQLANQAHEMIETMKDMIAAFDEEQLAIGSEEYTKEEVEIQKLALNFMHIKRIHTNYEFGAEWAINNIFSRILMQDNDIANFVNNNSQLVRVKYDETGKEVDSIGYLESLTIMDYAHNIDYSDYKLEFRKAAKDPELNPEGLGELTHLCIDDTVNSETLTGMADLRRDCINSNSYHK